MGKTKQDRDLDGLTETVQKGNGAEQRCVKCGLVFTESPAVCESDKCCREEAAYAKFVYYNGKHCIECFTNAQSLQERTLALTKEAAKDVVVEESKPDVEPFERPLCPNCHTDYHVRRGSGSEWVCSVCTWMKSE